MEIKRQIINTVPSLLAKKTEMSINRTDWSDDGLRLFYIGSLKSTRLALAKQIKPFEEQFLSLIGYPCFSSKDR
jgi:hypothetical protein